MGTNQYESPRAETPGRATVPAGSWGHFASWGLAFFSSAAGLFLGWLIWAISKPMTGYAEPWDSDGYYYFGALFLSGFAVALPSPRHGWLGVLGIYLGQLAYMHLWYAATLTPGQAPLLLSLLFLAIFGLFPAVCGALLPLIGYCVWKFR